MSKLTYKSARNIFNGSKILTKPKKSLYTWKSKKYDIYSTSISHRSDKGVRFCAGSFCTSKRSEILKKSKSGVIQTKPSNEIVIVQMENSKFRVMCKHKVTHPAIKLKFLPSTANANLDLICIGSDNIEICLITKDIHQRIISRAILQSGIIGSFDWNRIDLTKVISCGIDGIVTLFDIKNGKKVLKIVAHEQEIYDIATTSCNKDTFVTGSRDGTIRLFDLRSLDFSTIIAKRKHPIVKVRSNYLNEYLISFIEYGQKSIFISDVRLPTKPVLTLDKGHMNSANDVAWAPHSTTHLISCGDDGQALMWDIAEYSQLKSDKFDPVLCYQTEKNEEIVSCQWGTCNKLWVLCSTSNDVRWIKL